MRVARRAGTKLASIAAVDSTAAASVITSGSNGLTWYSRPLSSLPTPAASSSPIAKTDERRAQAFAHHQPLDVAAGRAERHADADLTRPPRTS